MPVLIGAASLVLLLQPGITRLAGGMLDERSPALLAGVFGVGVYGGYFGAAAGVVLLALLTVSVAEPLARLVAVRNVALGLANLVAAAGFVLFGPGPLGGGGAAGGGVPRRRRDRARPGPPAARGPAAGGDRPARPRPGRQARARHLRPGRRPRVDCRP